MTHSVDIFSHLNRTESYKHKFVFKHFALLYCTPGNEPEPPEPYQNFYPEPEPHKNDAAPQHWFKVYLLWLGIHSHNEDLIFVVRQNA
jgi:hypothetical protein